MRIGDTDVTLDNWVQVMAGCTPGGKLPILYERDGNASSTVVTVGERVETYTRLAQAGEPDSMIVLAGMYWNGQSVPINKEEALAWYRKTGDSAGADSGLQEWLGATYYYGRSAPKDFGVALGWYQKAAAQQNLGAMAQLGFMYSHAQGTALNGPEAVRWLKAAAERNNVAAEYYLGLVFFHGLGMPADAAQGVYWWRKAAEAGVPEAMTDLGYAEYEGLGIQKNVFDANNWYRKAAEKGNPVAQANLAGSHFSGVGTAQDFLESYFWYQLAKANGFSQPRPALDTLPQKLSPQQMSEAQRRVVAWMTATVLLTTDPPGASIYLNNDFRGNTDPSGHLEVRNIAPGEYLVRASSPGFEDRVEKYVFAKHGSYQPSIRLASATADLHLVTHPGSSQVYINDEFKGTSSAEGELQVRRLQKGSYRLRVSAPRFDDWTKTVELMPGPAAALEAKLHRSGPPPLSLQDVVDLLKGGISRVRAATLVKERGVDFSLSDDKEKQIRTAGGDSDLLLVIATNKK
jgi:TPR repeat protein